MKRISSLLAVWTALCLLCQLTGAALAQTAESPQEIVETVGWLPEQVGAWVGFHESLWGQYTFYRDGGYDLTVFEDPSLDRRGTYETIGKADSVTVEGELMRLAVRGITSVFRRMPNPWVRVKAKDEAASPSVNGALLGTWGGRIGEDYVEWTFHGDGRFVKTIPYQALTEEGWYLAGSRELAVILNGQIILCAYKTSANSITVDLFEDGRVILNKKTGHLTEMMIDEDGDFGWEDGQEWEVDRVLEVREAHPTKAEGFGTRFLVRIENHQRALFLQDDGRWFVK